jgi:hypothetical protein
MPKPETESLEDGGAFCKTQTKSDPFRSIISSLGEHADRPRITERPGGLDLARERLHGFAQMTTTQTRGLHLIALIR